MLGVGLLLPWNALIASMDYFKDTFPDHKPSFTYLVAVTVPMVVCQLFCFFVTEWFGYQFKLTFTLAINTLCTALIVILPQLGDPTDKDHMDLVYLLTVIVMCIYGASVALLQVTCYGVAGPMPEITTAFMVGIGLSGLSVNGLRIILHSAMPSQNK